MGLECSHQGADSHFNISVARCSCHIQVHGLGQCIGSYLRARWLVRKRFGLGVIHCAAVELCPLTGSAIRTDEIVIAFFSISSLWFVRVTIDCWTLSKVNWAWLVWFLVCSIHVFIVAYFSSRAIAPVGLSFVVVGLETSDAIIFSHTSLDTMHIIVVVDLTTWVNFLLHQHHTPFTSIVERWCSQWQRPDTSITLQVALQHGRPSCSHNDRFLYKTAQH